MGTIDGILARKGSEIFSMPPDATVFEAIEMMAARNVGALLVVRDGELVGVISERDYTRKVFLRGKRSRETQVQEIMSTELTTVEPNKPVEDCLRMMTDRHIRHLPVMDSGKLVGILSIGDLVKHVISTQSATIKQLENYISGGLT
ncbi:MAG: CBS domain-containing protein [Verrucomicrobiota bacterium]|nr:CBS domain-containing protein [Verrucomicrobiota bacterium]